MVPISRGLGELLSFQKERSVLGVSPSPPTVRARRKAAAWDDDYLAGLLTM